MAFFRWNQRFKEDDGVPLPIRLQLQVQPLGIVHVKDSKGKKLMGQPLVQSQRFGCFLRNSPAEHGQGWFSPLPWVALVGTLDWACLHGLDSSVGLFLCPSSLGLFLCPSSLGLFLLLSHLESYKMDNNDTFFHEFLSLMDFYCQQIFNIFWALICICNGSLIMICKILK